MRVKWQKANFMSKRLIQSINEFRGKRVLIMGLGSKDGGVGAARFAHSAGAHITITDIQPEDNLKPALKELNDISFYSRFGGHQLDDFLNNDIIIKNAGIRRDNSYLQKAAIKDKIIDTPTGIFSEIHQKPFIGITGTKGKSYTTHLTSHLLNQCNNNSIAAGNNCISPLRYVFDSNKLFVLELSSWQLYEMGLHKKSPHIGCWLNLFPDHMNYYSNIHKYKADKYNITRFQTSKDFLILPGNKNFYQSLPIKSNVLFFDADSDPELSTQLPNGCFLKNDSIIFRYQKNNIKIISLNELPGEFLCKQHLELLTASLCNSFAYFCYSGQKKFPLNELREGIKNFPGLSHRFEILLNKKNIQIINDSASSTPQSTEKAIDSAKIKPLILIMGGGGHKNLNYERLVQKITDKKIEIILFSEDKTSEKILQLLKNHKYKQLCFAKNLEEAVNLGFSRLYNRGTLLLSPGCSGAPFFRDMFERGDIFKYHIDKLLNKNSLK